MLGAAGGALGLLFGIAGAVVAPHIGDVSVQLSPWVAVGAIAMAMTIGVLFGVYPATRAARLAPIDALRSE